MLANKNSAVFFIRTIIGIRLSDVLSITIVTWAQERRPNRALTLNFQRMHNFNYKIIFFHLIKRLLSHPWKMSGSIQNATYSYVIMEINDCFVSWEENAIF